MPADMEVPNGKEYVFENEYPGRDHYQMLPTSDKQSLQLRIMLNTTRNCPGFPGFLRSEITSGGGYNSPGCISRGLFVERLAGEFGFKFTVDCQDVDRIRRMVSLRYPHLMSYFDNGFNR